MELATSLRIASLLFTGCAPGFNTLEGEYVFNDPYYYGIIDQNILKNQSYKWFDKQYSQYNPNIEKLSKTDLKDIDIAIFMGTWCHDSKREVPRGIKLFNLLALDNERIKIVALNKQKKGYFKNYESFNIKRTPLKARPTGRSAAEPPTYHLFVGVGWAVRAAWPRRVVLASYHI